MIGSDNGRRLPNWIESFTRYSQPINSPEIFRKWAGIGIVSAVMERRIWARTKGSNLYPNSYIILVAPSGVGKSQVLSLAEMTLRKVPKIHVAPSSLTTASLIDTLALAKRNMVTPGYIEPVTEFYSLQTVASELGVFLPEYAPAFMNTLTKLYDGEYYEERRRTGKVNHIIIEKPLLSLIGGTTPSYLNSFLPDGAWEQGFTSRTIFIFSKQIIKGGIWEDMEADGYGATFYEDLLADLKQMTDAYGKITWSPDCMEALSEWDVDGLKPAPTHPKLTNYCTRRLAHCLKLSIVSSMSRSNDRFVTLEDFQTARGWLLEAEESMAEVFDIMGASTEAKISDDILFFISKLYYRDGKRPVGEHMIFAYLRDRMPHNTIPKTLEILVRSKDLQMTIVNGTTAYIPLSRHHHEAPAAVVRPPLKSV